MKRQIIKQQILMGIFVVSTMGFSVWGQTLQQVQNKINSKAQGDTVHVATSGNYMWYIVKKTKDNATGELFALLMSYTLLDNGNVHEFNAAGGNNTYSGSKLQATMKSEFKYLPANIKSMAVQPALGNTSTTAVSTPTSTIVTDQNNPQDGLFPPSYREMYDFNKSSTVIGSSSPLHVYASYAQGGRFWTRTASSLAGEAWEIYAGGSSFVEVLVNSSNVCLVGMVWVKYGVLYTVSGTVFGLQNNAGKTVYYTIDNGAQKSVTTASDGSYTIPDVPQGSNVVIIPSAQSNYIVGESPAPITNIVANHTNQDIIYCPLASVTGSSTICKDSTTTLSPTSGGSWTSSDTAVATVTNAGVVTGVSAGTVTFTFSTTVHSTTCNTNTIAVTVKAPPIITVHPSLDVVALCDTLSFSPLTVTAIGTNLTYQWYSNTIESNSGGTLILGATNTHYTPAKISGTDSYYYCIVTGDCGFAISNVSGKHSVLEFVTPSIIISVIKD